MVRAGHADAPRQLGLQLEHEGRVRDLRTPTLVVGNNKLQLEHVGIPADELDRQRLIAMAAHPVGTLALYGLLLRGLFSRLGEAEQVVNFAFDRASAPSPREGRDGRRNLLDEHPLEFKVAEDALPLVTPGEQDSDTVST